MVMCTDGSQLLIYSEVTGQQLYVTTDTGFGLTDSYVIGSLNFGAYGYVNGGFTYNCSGEHTIIYSDASEMGISVSP